MKLILAAASVAVVSAAACDGTITKTAAEALTAILKIRFTAVSTTGCDVTIYKTGQTCSDGATNVDNQCFTLIAGATTTLLGRTYTCKSGGSSEKTALVAKDTCVVPLQGCTGTKTEAEAVATKVTTVKFTKAAFASTDTGAGSAGCEVTYYKATDTCTADANKVVAKCFMLPVDGTTTINGKTYTCHTDGSSDAGTVLAKDTCGDATAACTGGTAADALKKTSLSFKFLGKGGGPDTGKCRVEYFTDGKCTTGKKCAVVDTETTGTTATDAGIGGKFFKCDTGVLKAYPTKDYTAADGTNVGNDCYPASSGFAAAPAILAAMLAQLF